MPSAKNRLFPKGKAQGEKGGEGVAELRRDAIFLLQRRYLETSGFAAGGLMRAEPRPIRADIGKKAGKGDGGAGPPSASRLYTRDGVFFTSSLTEYPSMQLNGARILIECLIREGVDIIFGYPGGSVLDIYDELPHYGDQLRHVLVRHEQAAVHAADGYARATGKVGVCMATSGPGATNTVTGIATAYCDSIPLVIFTGQVPTGLIGNDAFQEVDIAGITRPCTKHNYMVKDVKELAKVVRQAFYLARSGRPGPVLVDLPKNVLQGSADFVWPEDVSMRSYNPTYRPNYAQIRKVVDALHKAERPLLFGGGGVIMSNASEEFRNLAASLHIPVTCSLMGLGAFPGNHPQWLGMLGMHGTYAANKAVSNADLLLAVGVRFDDRVTGRLSSFAPKATIVHIDIDPTSIHKNVNVRIPVVGDCRNSLVAIREHLANREHLSFPVCFCHKRQRCIASGTPDHVRFISVKIHHRIICPYPDFAVM